MSNIQPVDQLKQIISSDAMKSQMKAALPSHVTVEKFNRVVMTALSNSPDLVKADRTSLFSAMLKAAADGLIPDGREAALVVYGGKAQYLPMFAGILKKMRNSGELKAIQTQIVHKNDDFSYWIDESGEHINFKPDFFSDRGEPIGVFSIGETKDGGKYFDIMSKADVEKIKASSKSAGTSFSPWSGPHYLEMWKKTSVRRIAKKMPSSTDIDQVFASDDGDYDFTPVGSTAENEKNPSVQKGAQAAENKKPARKSRLESVVESKSFGTEPIEVKNQVVSEDQIPI